MLHDIPDVNDNNWNNNENEDESSIVLDTIRPTSSISNRSLTNNKNLQYRQRNDTIQPRQYRTRLQQLQAMFWPTREIHNTISNKQLNEYEQIPMVTKKTNN
ncbi:unnamed protein product [Rotaria sordida]|uniref:Uncharacterized protein n=1 Tax=Rotaria sordida TaxID=392033 RepID=A0A819B289_9BILA|nr:unnamed protein product [Rotaria sordida]